MTTSRRTNLLLAIGLISGVLLAAFGILGDSRMGDDPAQDEEMVAMVNGRGVPRARYEQALALIERDLGRPVTTQERQRALDRIIDEELLVAKAQELGVAESDRRLRAELVSAVLDSVAERAHALEPSEKELRRFYEDNKTLIFGAAQYRIAAVFVSAEGRTDDEALARARQAAERLRSGQDLEEVTGSLGDTPAVAVPHAPIPAPRLAEVVGPTAAARLVAMAPGDVSEPIAGAGGYRVVVLLERSAVPAADFASARERVLAEFRRRAAEDEVTRYLDELRAGADISVVRDDVEAAKVGLGPR